MKRASLTAEQSGVYQTPPDWSSAREYFAGSGADCVDIDLADARTKEQLLDAFARSLSFPATFGRNWDALADALQDLSWHPARAYVLHLLHAAAARRALAADWPTLLEVLSATATYWKSRGTPFIVFVDEAREYPQWS
jgi:RNAse (barnase) inhibitor barstar